MTRPKAAVFPFQLDGCAYQPPAGDQTCLGYLSVGRLEVELWHSVGMRETHGILGPPPYETSSQQAVESIELGKTYHCDLASVEDARIAWVSMSNLECRRASQSIAAKMANG